MVLSLLDATSSAMLFQTGVSDVTRSHLPVVTPPSGPDSPRCAMATDPGGPSSLRASTAAKRGRDVSSSSSSSLAGDGPYPAATATAACAVLQLVQTEPSPYPHGGSATKRARPGSAAAPRRVSAEGALLASLGSLVAAPPCWTGGGSAGPATVALRRQLSGSRLDLYFHQQLQQQQQQQQQVLLGTAVAGDGGDAMEVEAAADARPRSMSF